MTPSPMLQVFFDKNKQYMVENELWDKFNEIIFFVHHDKNNYAFLTDLLKTDTRCKILVHMGSVGRLEEQYTNRSIKNYCDQSPEPFIFLRFHNKGITYVTSPGYPDPMKIEYTKITNEGNIGCWREAVEKLSSGSDCAGINWTKTPWPHFVGNVWWATSDYIKRLILLKLPHENNFVQQIPGPNTWLAHDAESWIGTGSPRAWDLLNKTSEFVIHPNPLFRV